MSGRAPRRKGDRLERLVVSRFRAAGIAAKRVPLSGSAAGYPGDVMAELPGLGEISLECKSRASSSLYAWLGDHGALVVKGDRREPLVVLRLADLLRVIDDER